MKRRLHRSIAATVGNARRLLDDANFLELSEPPLTAFFLALIAQEELAKAFLLALAYRGVIPWDRHILRATQDHAAKQLVCIIMDYLYPETDEFLARCNAVVLQHENPRFPPKVADAINLLRHEKIGRWESRNWVWAEDPTYDPEALLVSEGKLDRLKQDTLYIRLSKDGNVIPPSVFFSRDRLTNEVDRVGRFISLVERMVDTTSTPGLDYVMVERVLRYMFTRTSIAPN